MPEWFWEFMSATVLVIWGFMSATVLAIIGWFLTRLQRTAEKRDEQRQAVAALRFELESNLGWLDNIFESRNYLRDEAWVQMKNKGYISYLPSPIPSRVIETYDQLHGLNEKVRLLKETEKGELNFDEIRADFDKASLHGTITSLMTLLDEEFPEIGKNFRK